MPKRSLLALFVFAACSPDAPRARTPTSSQLSTEIAGDNPGPPAPSADPAVNMDGPEISRSVGAQGGVVVMWPRVSGGAKDAASTELAMRVQTKLRALVEKAVPGAPIDLRPEPERVCPRPNGCKGAAVGAIVRVNGKACAVVALVSGAGASPQRIVGWAGALKADALTVPFREPPEPHVKVSDYASCAKLDAALDANEADVVSAIRAAVPR